MKKVGTYISNDCTKKVLLYVDRNGHYTVKRLADLTVVGERKFKKIESAQRAVNKWIKK
jgi:hypothetical protein